MLNDAARQQQALDRMRRIAGGLLLCMALLLILARGMGPERAPWPYVAAFAEAALVGGMADWYAVTALFRHPLGIRMPHSAIIPNNKERIGLSIGNFLQYNFMTQHVVREELDRVDFAGAAADWLAAPEHSAEVAAQLTRALPALLRDVDEHQVRAVLQGALAGAFDGVRLAPALGQVLGLLVAGRQHHVLLERILGIVARALEQNRPYLRGKVHQHSPRWLPRALDDQLFERLLEGVHAILIEIQAEDSEWRARFDQAAHEMVARLSDSDAYEQSLHAMLARGAGHPAVRTYAAEVWRTLKARVLADCAAQASRIAAASAAALQGLGTALQADAELRARLNASLRALVADTIVERRDLIAAVVWRVLRNWDAETVSRKFELQVGKDLQYIRLNGTVVGGAVGVLLHGMSSLLLA
jgi:uncharacterized membrane-anchored protein YjiN (DUF445 family)